MKDSQIYWKEDEHWCRICPKCGKKIVYSSPNICESFIKYIVKKKSICRDCCNKNKCGRPLPKKKEIIIPLKVDDISEIKIKVKDNRAGYDYTKRFDKIIQFKVIEYVCQKCGKSIVRKIPMGESYLARCVHCGAWTSVNTS